MVSASSNSESPLNAARERTILHLDMDAFFASVEILRRPELRGRPVVVGGDGARGVVAAASYEARSFGVFSAMPSVRARRLCPGAVFIHGDYAHYSTVSKRIMDILRAVTPLVEPLSLDEAFCDVTGVLHSYPDVTMLAQSLRDQIRAQEELECAVGVGASKFVAKLASKRAKPRIGPPGSGPGPGIGVLVVNTAQQETFLHALEVRELWGVGPVMLRQLTSIGVVTVGDLAAIPQAVLVGRFGSGTGQHLYELAHGIDPRPVVPDRASKSVGHEETYSHDITVRAEANTEVLRLADATATRLAEHALVGRTVQLKVRFADFATITRSRTIDEPTSSGRTIGTAARQLLDGIDTSRGVRLLGVTASNLSEAGGAQQLSLDVDGDEMWSDTEHVISQVRARFGADAIAPAALLGEHGVKVRRRGDQQWGKNNADESTPPR